jgi:hypothetical protein
MKKIINHNKGDNMKIKSTYKNETAKKLYEEAWNDLGSRNMDFDSFKFSAALIEAGEYKALYKIMSEMDSIPREYIFDQLPIDKKIEYQKEVA